MFSVKVCHASCANSVWCKLVLPHCERDARLGLFGHPEPARIFKSLQKSKKFNDLRFRVCSFKERIDRASRCAAPTDPSARAKWAFRGDVARIRDIAASLCAPLGAAPRSVAPLTFQRRTSRFPQKGFPDFQMEDDEIQIWLVWACLGLFGPVSGLFGPVSGLFGPVWDEGCWEDVKNSRGGR